MSYLVQSQRSYEPKKIEKKPSGANKWQSISIGLCTNI